ncbi:MAG TPA: type II TA system antitoxin MqsA family protein [Polyangia bacterium]|jgi:putative zinc finger/helix-turn-helix YgiT family protein|nr:type II TA system antitoxin MqsA family protein [Polyangia bacterium]
MANETRICPGCGGTLQSGRENYKYTACGLPNITLMNVEVSRCKNCGEEIPDIPHVEALHREIAFAIIKKHARLTPAEIRYLRKYLGLSGVSFAELMGVDATTVSRWESEKMAQPMGPQAERLLRLLVARIRPVGEYPAETLARVAQGQPIPIRLGLMPRDEGWETQAA